MSLQDESSLERSPVVANNRMNRERGVAGVNSYDRELGALLLPWLRMHVALRHVALRKETAWLDLCCGRGRALIEAASSLDVEERKHIRFHGVDLVNAFDDIPAEIDQVTFEVASLHQWQPKSHFDLITCVHGLHYIGDKLGLIARMAAWLTPTGVLLASLDLANLRSTDDARFDRRVRTWLKASGVEYNARRHSLLLNGQRTITSPFRFVGADDEAGPNYSGQPAVNSYYVQDV